MISVNSLNFYALSSFQRIEDKRERIEEISSFFTANTISFGWLRVFLVSDHFAERSLIARFRALIWVPAGGVGDDFEVVRHAQRFLDCLGVFGQVSEICSLPACA